MYKFLPVFFFFLVCTVLLEAQVPPFHIDNGRVIFHDKVDAVQERLKALDGHRDDSIQMAKDPVINREVEFALIDKVDEMQRSIDLCYICLR